MHIQLSFRRLIEHCKFLHEVQITKLKQNEAKQNKTKHYFYL